MSVESELKDLTDSFEKSSAELFSITGRFFKTFELGVYACALAKPTKRMKKSLGVDREIFVVISNFKDQQQRTIRFLKAEIEASAGRYEPGIAFVVHMDPDGDSKLKNWGRDHSISILSIHNPAVFSNSSELEKYLCQELYSHDPFDVSGPVSDDGNFFGRRDEALDLAKKLQKGQIRSCLGIRKIGKTSIINRIVNEIKANQICLCIMIDCSKDDVWSLSASQLLASISESIKLANNSPQRYSKIQTNNTEINIGNARNSLEVEILASSFPIVLVFDEIDYITPGSPTNIEWKQEFNIFWRNLRSIYQETLRQHKVLSMLIGGVSTYWFTVESIDGIENAALSFVPEEYLSPLQQGASIAMIKRLGKISGLEFADDAAIHIARETANMPFWTRKCCSYIHRNISINGRPSEVNLKFATELVDKFVDEEGVVVSEVALNHLFRVHPDLKNAIMKCHHDEFSQVKEHLKRVLKRYGVISHGNKLSGIMLSKAFNNIETDDSIKLKTPEPTNNTNSRHGLEEWAEELAVINKRRNILEFRLRELSLNFIRVNCINKNKPSDIKNEILSIISEKQREGLHHLSADDVIKKLMWKDLINLMKKNWPLFEKILGNQNEFLQACEIINDRYDAHAKPADIADFALYRRALKQIEDLIAKIQ